jgi:hypothetical protein
VLDTLKLALIVGIPVAFATLWFGATCLVGLLSGWYGLMQRYPDRAEPELAKVRLRRAFMGRGVLGAQMNGVLTLAACPSGLRLSIWRVFGPYCRPFLVPWSEIHAEAKQFLFVKRTQLRFGTPEAGRLSLDSETWEKLAAHGPPALARAAG